MNLSPVFNRGEYVGKCTNIKTLLDLTFKNGNNCLLHGKRFRASNKFVFRYFRITIDV